MQGYDLSVDVNIRYVIFLSILHVWWISNPWNLQKLPKNTFETKKKSQSVKLESQL